MGQKYPEISEKHTQFIKEQKIFFVGTATSGSSDDPEWNALFALFDPIPGARQIFDLAVDMVQTSCGMAVPYYSYEAEREQLKNRAEKKGPDGLKGYWEEKNQIGIDGIATNIVVKNV